MIEKNGYTQTETGCQLKYTREEMDLVIAQCKEYSTSVGLVWWVNRRGLADYPFAIDTMTQLILMIFGEHKGDVEAWFNRPSDVTRRPMPSENVDIQGED